MQHLGRQWIHVIRGPWKNLHIFYDAANSNPEAFHSRCFVLQVRLARLARWNLDTISMSSPFLTVCGNFRCSVQHFSEPSMMKNSSSRAHAISYQRYVDKHIPLEPFWLKSGPSAGVPAWVLCLSAVLECRVFIHFCTGDL